MSARLTVSREPESQLARSIRAAGDPDRDRQAVRAVVMTFDGEGDPVERMELDLEPAATCPSPTS